jgi:glyoxylase-like metal-dependent hydrolase (beta-lactamase superfamily II)
VLIGGDHLLETITANPMAHVDLAAPDPAALAASPERPRPLVTMLRSLRATAEDPPELVLPGHGEPFGGAAEIVAKRFAAHERRARRILRALDAPRAAAGIIETLWRQLPAEQGFLALSEVLGHLDLLADRGDAAEVDLGGGRVAWARI